MLKVQKLIQYSKDLRSKVVKLRKQLIDKIKQYKGMTLERKEDDDNCSSDIDDNLRISVAYDGDQKV